MIIIGLSGRKESGKSTMRNFLFENCKQIFFPNRAHVGHLECLPMAAPIKEFCHNVLGIEHRLLYGTNEEKETLTKYRWEDLPHRKKVDEEHELGWRIFKQHQSSRYAHIRPEPAVIEAEDREWSRANPLPVGYMTARQVMQQVGEMMRMMNKRCWADAWVREANSMQDTDLLIADDVRHPEEIEAIHSLGGKVYRLPRNAHKDDHISEKALDDYHGFDGVVGKGTETLEETKLLLTTLIVRGLLAKRGA